jgi:hypothetical protein
MGICKLCGLDKELQDSHFVGKAVYRKANAPELENPSPVAFSRDKAQQSSMQLRDFVFCFDCEQIFNNRGERWIHQRIATTQDFKLLDLFTGQTPTVSQSDYKLFRCRDVSNLDCGAMLHYGAGIFFKAAVHKWVFEGDVTSYIEIDEEYVKALQSFVKNGVQLPQNILVVAGVASTKPRFLGFIPPVEMRASVGREFVFYVSGVLYWMKIGGHIDEAQGKISLSSSGYAFVFVNDDIESTAFSIMKTLATGSVPTERLRELMRRLAEGEA